MRFNRPLPKELCEFLEKQYKEYLKATPMTRKEQRALREWVKDGHSVYENDCGAWAEGGVPVEFLTIFRDEEYIRQNTKGMTPEETRKFAMHYYGWDDDDAPERIRDEFFPSTPFDDYDENEELPFR